MKNRADLIALDGGSDINIRSSNKHFISSYVTDTRLMGVLVVYAHWHVDTLRDGISSNGNVTWGDLHQFFYIDCEEAGLETYHEVRKTDAAKINEVEQLLIGGLGAGKVDLDEDQLRTLMCYYQNFNKEHGLPLPDKKTNYDFIFDGRDYPDDEKLYRIMKHICPEIKTDYQLINFFLMRLFGRDHRGAAFLAAGDTDVHLYDSYIKATFWRNTIDKKRSSAEGTGEYLCESLVEMNGNYDVIISRIAAKDLVVTEVECLNKKPVTSTEAALIMRKNEFISLYEILLSEEELEANLDEFRIGFHSTVSTYENGRLFLFYRSNNDHVNSRIFQLNEDVRGLFFVSNNGQLIVTSYDPVDADKLDDALRSNILSPYLSLNARYEFIEPVIYEFMHSDIDYFENYLQMIKSDE